MSEKSFQLVGTKAIDEAQATVDFVFTTDDLDRDSEVVLPQGAMLGNYRKNPLFLWSHERKKFPALGRALVDRIRITSKELSGPVKFDVDNDPFAAMIFRKYVDKFLTSVSIGFMPKEFGEPISDGQRGATIRVWEMLELSAVNVPANPEALAKEYEAAKGSYDDWATPYYQGIIKLYESEKGQEWLKSDGQYDKIYPVVVNSVVDIDDANPEGGKSGDGSGTEKSLPPIIQSLENSYEWITQKLNDGIEDYAVANNSIVGYRPDYDSLRVVATYKKEAVFVSMGWDRPYSEDKVFSAPYRMSGGVPEWREGVKAIELVAEIRELALQDVGVVKRLGIAPVDKDFDPAEAHVNVFKYLKDLPGADSDSFGVKYEDSYAVIPGEEPPVNLIHHDVIDGELVVVFDGVVKAMAHLQTVDLPESIKLKAYEHLAEHYALFDQEPPSVADVIGDVEASDLLAAESLFKDLSDSNELVEQMAQHLADKLINQGA